MSSLEVEITVYTQNPMTQLELLLSTFTFKAMFHNTREKSSFLFLLVQMQFLNINPVHVLGFLLCE